MYSKDELPKYCVETHSSFDKRLETNFRSNDPLASLAMVSNLALSRKSQRVTFTTRRTRTSRLVSFTTHPWACIIRGEEIPSPQALILRLSHRMLDGWRLAEVKNWSEAVVSGDIQSPFTSHSNPSLYNPEDPGFTKH